MRSAGIRIKKSVTKAACTADKVVNNQKNHLYFSCCCWREVAVVVAVAGEVAVVVAGEVAVVVAGEVAVVVAGEVGGGGGVGGGGCGGG